MGPRRQATVGAPFFLEATVPFYNDLRPDDDDSKLSFAQVFPGQTNATERKRILTNLLTLRAELERQIRPRVADQNLLIASWNIKEFGHTTQRLPEAYFYLAEILSRFDLIAVQEVKGGLEDLRILMRLLGDSWSYLINDITEGTAGNKERSAYIYNRARVDFGGLAGEIVLPDTMTQGLPLRQLARTPYITGFRAGWKTFAMVNVHLEPGKSDSQVQLRGHEVDLLLQAIDEKRKDDHLWNDNLILCGDFNFHKTHDAATVAKVHAGGYREVTALQGVDTNASDTEVYDRLFLTDNEYFTVATDDLGHESGGVFRLFDHLYPDERYKTYRKYMKDDYTGAKDLDIDANLLRYFKNPWRKNQLSDHYPIWFELVIDSADVFLQQTLDAH